MAEALLPDRAEPVAEPRSSFRSRLSRSLDVERASLFCVSAGSSDYRGDRENGTGHLGVWAVAEGTVLGSGCEQ